MMKKPNLLAASLLLLFGLFASLESAAFGQGMAMNQGGPSSGVAQNSGVADVDTTLPNIVNVEFTTTPPAYSSLLLADSFGVIEQTPLLLDSEGYFFAVFISSALETEASDLSLSLVDGYTGQSSALALVFHRPGPYDADDVRQVLDRLPSGTGNVKLVPTESDLDDLFIDLSEGGNTNTPATYPGIGAMLPDGTWIGIRPDSSSGGTGDTTIDIRYPDGSTAKVHISP